MSFTVASSGDGLHFKTAVCQCQTPYRKLLTVLLLCTKCMHVAEVSCAYFTRAAGKLIIKLHDPFTLCRHAI